MTSNDNSIPTNSGGRIHLIVDMLNDFISGSMACNHAREAISKIIDRINAYPQEEVVYICDSHPSNHCSFAEQGGPWPPHCVKHSFGQQIDLAFYTRVEHPHLRPRISENIFEKGWAADREEYSGYQAIGPNGKKLSEFLLPGQPVIISGIATEYCVLESAKDLLANGHPVEVLQDGLGYVTMDGHKQALSQMKELGVKMC
ncbi:MAG: isochorismatase family protein [Bacteroidales bacterium]|nr:isochorismatase family protein [Bacteroidales bacterium]MCL2738405.1 isochorismatase family protein [Bacteroidales bacterium]